MTKMIRVLADGCFDCLHIGHVRHLQAARALGDELIVALTNDQGAHKGPGRPLFGWHERWEMLMALKCVDAVLLTPNASQAIEMIRPDIYVKGIEYKHYLPETLLVEQCGGRVILLDTKPTYSSTAIVTGQMLNDRIRVAG